MYQIEFTCQYCGNIWRQYLTSEKYMPVCSCGEKKLITYKKLDVDSGDYFGYNEGAPPKKDSYIK